MAADLKTEPQFNSPDWLLSRRIAHPGYPYSEARYGSLEEYVKELEEIKWMYEDLKQ